LGLAALDALLEAMHFSPRFEFSFGARSRDFGYHPTLVSEVQHWYRSVLALAEEFAAPNSLPSDGVKSAIANNFRYLWSSNLAALIHEGMDFSRRM
jgi:hypothetical protein